MPTFTGTEGADVLTGSTGPDLILGLGGADTITGNGGADSLNGGDGADVFVIPNGAGGLSSGRIDGGAGLDTLDVSGYQIPTGMIQSHIVTSQDGVASLSFFSRYQPPPNTGPILNTPVGTAAGVEIFSFGPGSDDVDLSGLSSVTVSGGAGSDLIIGGSQASSIFGDVGNDRLVGSPGADALDGGVGADTISGAGGSDTINGGDGTDLLRLAGRPDDYLFQQTAAGWSIHAGRSTVITVANMEQVQFGPGTAQAIETAPSVDFNAEAYLARYADLRAAFGADPVKAFQHYQTYGIAEGRAVTETPFNALNYTASHPDLIRAFGTDTAAAARHFAEYGQAEGRTVSFDPLVYAAGYNDLARLIGTDAGAAAAHYITYGATEGRATSGFDSVAYLLSNTDLTGMSPQQALSHWLTYGADEGRAGDALFGREQTSHVVVNGLATGLIESRTDRDWFEVSMPVGRDVTFTPSPYGNNIDGGEVHLALYDGGGRSLISNFNAITYRAVDDTDGPYYLVVTSRASGAPYDYEVTQSIGPARSPQAAAGDDEDPSAAFALAHAAFALVLAPEAPYATEAPDDVSTLAIVRDWSHLGEETTI